MLDHASVYERTAVRERPSSKRPHAVRRSLVVAQADRLGLPFHAVDRPNPCPNDVYEQRMADALAVAHDDGATQMIFGDLFLEDVRAYRESALAPTGIEPRFPLWLRLRRRRPDHTVMRESGGERD